jgi:hypothetical protein
VAILAHSQDNRREIGPNKKHTEQPINHYRDNYRRHGCVSLIGLAVDSFRRRAVTPCNAGRDLRYFFDLLTFAQKEATK